MLVSDSQLKTSAHSSHVALAVVLQVRDGVLQALLWERARDPDAGRWALPGGDLLPGETLDDSLRRHLAAKVVVRELSHLEQLGTWSEPDRLRFLREADPARRSAGARARRTYRRIDEATVALAVRADRTGRRAVAVLRAAAPAGHRPVRRSGRRAAAHRRTRPRRADVAFRQLPRADARGRAPLRR